VSVRKQDLQALRDMAAAEEWCSKLAYAVFGIGKSQAPYAVFGIGKSQAAYKAFDGGLGAAMALHKALLPGWILGWQANGAMWVAKRPYTFQAMPSGGNIARAWLLCILDALIAEADNG
jgi:hypothetical protein